MFKDNASWVSGYAKNKNTFFIREQFNGRIFLIAGNRAARRLLLSQFIQNEAKKRGAVIEVENIEGNAQLITIG